MLLEQTWTVIPILVLLTIAAPSILVLILQDAAMTTVPDKTINLVRSQWRWTDEHHEFFTDTDKKLDRLASYQTPLKLSTHGLFRVSITRRDVLHALGFPRLGIKIDSVPGRTNTVLIEKLTPGRIVGSCYELCGMGHRRIPLFSVEYFKESLEGKKVVFTPADFSKPNVFKTTYTSFYYTEYRYDQWIKKERLDRIAILSRLERGDYHRWCYDHHRSYRWEIILEKIDKLRTECLNNRTEIPEPTLRTGWWYAKAGLSFAEAAVVPVLKFYGTAFFLIGPFLITSAITRLPGF